MSSIYLYAELLLNIRQVTVFATLPSNSHQGTYIRLFPDQKTLQIRHQDIEASIELPCQVSDTTTLKIPENPSKELSFRLGIDPGTVLRTSTDPATDQLVPWPASKLSSETQLACQSCGNLLVKDVANWKDLPSGGWADMMDFWHCHKPTPQDGAHEAVGSDKGYAAANDLGPTAGVGLVDISYFLLSESDCMGVQRTDGQKTFICSQCRDPVGLEEKRLGTVRLFKWSLAVQRTWGDIWETYSVQEIVSAQLIASIEDQATNKYLAYGGNIEDAKDGLLLWVFIPDLKYSTSKRPAQRAMKVFYETTTSHSSFLVDQHNNLEELQLPQHALKQLKESLESSTTLLPPSARTYQTWTIGLLHR